MEPIIPTRHYCTCGHDKAYHDLPGYQTPCLAVPACDCEAYEEDPYGGDDEADTRETP